MLVLSRRVGESVVIGDELIVTITFIGSEAVELTLTGRDNSFLKSSVLGLNDRLLINDEIQVVLIRLQRERARLGIETPPGTSVARRENL